MNKLLSIVVPCYNEENVISMFYFETRKALEKLDIDYEIIFVDDGSTDKTFEEQKKLKQSDDKIKIISFSRNFGKEAALYAGLEQSKGDFVVTMDADLQHNPKLLPEMVSYMYDGYDAVTTRRIDRNGESFFKRLFSGMFYKICKNFMDVKIPEGLQDYRMMKRNVVDAILSLDEYNRFSKGIFNWVGFKTKIIDVKNESRAAGKSKWGMKKLFGYALDGITSFSTAPLKVSTIFGIIVSILSALFGIEIIIQTLIMGKEAPGYASIIVSVLFIGGIQLLSIGILSEYISKMYLEIKGRPKYIIKDKEE